MGSGPTEIQKQPLWDAQSSGVSKWSHGVAMPVQPPTLQPHLLHGLAVAQKVLPGRSTQ
jgi:hypothetical protein